MNNMAAYIRKKYLVPYCSSNRSFEIKEDDPGTFLKSIFIDGLTDNSIGIKYDDERTCTIALLNNRKKKINKAADGIVIHPIGEQVTIFIIELKSKEYKINDIWAKFHNTKDLMNHILCIYQRYEDLSLSFENIHYKYILFSRNNPKKGVTPTVRKITYKDIEFYDEFAYSGKRFDVSRYRE